MCRPTKDKETTTVANEMLENWFWIIGIPVRILSDRRKAFRSKLVEAICAILDVERFNTTPGYFQCDGQSEESVQQIKKRIRAYFDENQNLGLKQMCFAYKSSVH